MAAKSFLICNSIRFKEDDYFVPSQIKLLEDEGTPEVNLKLIEENFHEGFSLFQCHYDYVHNKVGKVFDKPFTRYFEPMDFSTYFHRENNLALVQVKTDAALEFITEINSTKEYKLEPHDISFERIIKLVPEISGAWIAELKGKHLKTAGFFGPNVHMSDEYKDAIKTGKVSSMTIKWVSKEHIEYSITISKKGSITLFNNFKTIEEELDLVNDLFQKLIKPHAIEVTPKS
ncbi:MULTISPECIES: hypothetical protein [Lysinibacillus]|uniref:Uncharacterized protein n=1 Tax=Lysinibacillus fusiformis TaxID=28031 RepID=A0A2I0UYV9_9BACI|nr:MULTISPECIES: hypothetical protein [Lysinibacillus]PKU51251.1 hypothetical protein CRI88_11010 [Lysinibacillus fusiformis]SCY07611.1 hypothetical protein SAMN02787078_00725 [Lysinibacillus sp. SG9]SDB13618.1 hypothetical protein SAMN02787079_01047 [Lysinibacillus sp. TC-37]SFS52130.1 hypothetical protein SAMN02787087_01050 [Lysinibacillus sp. SG55]